MRVIDTVRYERPAMEARFTLLPSETILDRCRETTITTDRSCEHSTRWHMTGSVDEVAKFGARQLQCTDEVFRTGSPR